MGLQGVNLNQTVILGFCHSLGQWIKPTRETGPA
jgi:hypothetical protein